MPKQPTTQKPPAAKKPVDKKWSCRNRQAQAALNNPSMHLYRTYHLAACEAVTTDEIGMVMRVLLREALKGDVAAIKELLDRTCGKVRNVTYLPDQVLKIGKIKHPKDIATAVLATMNAVNEGEMSLEDAQKFSSILECALKWYESKIMERAEESKDKAAQILEFLRKAEETILASPEAVTEPVRDDA